MLKFLEKIKLELIVFLCGAIVMILELVGSRVVAPYFGNSLFVWTSLIGVILGSLSLGYYLGGKLSDRQPQFSLLILIIILSAIFIAGTAFVKEPLLSSFQKTISDTRLAVLIATIFLFAPASILLGVVSPFAAKLRLLNVKKSGQTIGNLYAISTLGSIIGTFLAGFYLIPAFGNTSLLYFLSFTLIIISLFSNRKTFEFSVIILLFVGVLYFLTVNTGLFKLKSIADIDSMYSRIIVDSTFDKKGQNELIFLRTDNIGGQSGVYAKFSEELAFTYTKYYRLYKNYNPEAKTALMLGGAGYTYPRDYLRNNPEGKIDVVEIDPEMTRLAKQYFFLKDDPRMNIIHQDARIYVEDNHTKYDVIFVDVFNGITPPYYLTTTEFFDNLKNRLNKNGVVMINLLAATDGEKSDFFKSEANTIKSVFSRLDLYYTETGDRDVAQNLMLVASLDSSKEISFSEQDKENYLTDFAQLKNNFSGFALLTDDHAPVEFLTKNYSLK